MLHNDSSESPAELRSDVNSGHQIFQPCYSGNLPVITLNHPKVLILFATANHTYGAVKTILREVLCLTQIMYHILALELRFECVRVEFRRSNLRDWPDGRLSEYHLKRRC